MQVGKNYLWIPKENDMLEMNHLIGVYTTVIISQLSFSIPVGHFICLLIGQVLQWSLVYTLAEDVNIYIFLLREHLVMVNFVILSCLNTGNLCYLYF